VNISGRSLQTTEDRYINTSSRTPLIRDKVNCPTPAHCQRSSWANEVMCSDVALAMFGPLFVSLLRDVITGDD